VLEKFGMGRVPAARFPWQQERLVKVWAFGFGFGYLVGRAPKLGHRTDGCGV